MAAAGYYDYQTAQAAAAGRNETRDYGRNGEIVTAATAGQISSQLQTTGTSTPALVAQALSGIASKDAFNSVLTVEEFSFESSKHLMYLMNHNVSCGEYNFVAKELLDTSNNIYYLLTCQNSHSIILGTRNR